MSEPLQKPKKRNRNQIGIAASADDLARLDALRKRPAMMAPATRSAMAREAMRAGLDALERAAKPARRSPRKRP